MNIRVMVCQRLPFNINFVEGSPIRVYGSATKKTSAIRIISLNCIPKYWIRVDSLASLFCENEDTNDKYFSMAKYYMDSRNSPAPSVIQDVQLTVLQLVSQKWQQLQAAFYENFTKRVPCPYKQMYNRL